MPIKLWATAVAESNDDVKGDARLSYLAFLFALAIDRPLHGAEILFERTFEEIYIAVWHSPLPCDSFEAIAHRIPVLPFWQTWDSCLRLRLAVTDAGTTGELERTSFERLSRDPTLTEQLSNLAASKGRRRRRL